MYVGVTYTGNGPYRSEVPAVSSRSLDSNSLFQVTIKIKSPLFPHKDILLCIDLLIKLKAWLSIIFLFPAVKIKFGEWNFEDKNYREKI